MDSQDDVQLVRVNRVVVNSDGEAVPPWRAAEHGIGGCQVAFLRSDEWVLGAPQRFERVAYELWRDEWIGYVRFPHTKFRPIEEYPD